MLMSKMVGDPVPKPSSSMSWESDTTTPMIHPGDSGVLKVPSAFTVRVVLIGWLACRGEFNEVLSPVPVMLPLPVMAACATKVS
jgi:hypothetical protein